MIVDTGSLSGHFQFSFAITLQIEVFNVLYCTLSYSLHDIVMHYQNIKLLYSTVHNNVMFSNVFKSMLVDILALWIPTVLYWTFIGQYCGQCKKITLKENFNVK